MRHIWIDDIWAVLTKVFVVAAFLVVAFLLGISYEQRQTAAGRVIDRAMMDMASAALRGECPSVQIIEASK